MVIGDAHCVVATLTACCNATLATLYRVRLIFGFEYLTPHSAAGR